ncbi:DUF72 domain-containing protein [Variovorax sp. Varisp62]|uniref:DUF72 domain-containing protein n=1 Tax=Variovorax sp. Varisp62 TaxID=3243049 RepID=UPI0039B44F55
MLYTRRCSVRVAAERRRIALAVVPSARVMAHIESIRQRLPRDTISIEFRHHSWWDGSRRRVETLQWLRAMHAVHTVVDGPQGAENSVPAVWEVTNNNYALVRLHGRNAETYNAAATPADRFSYEYSDDELRGLVGEVVRLSYKVRHAHMIFNNCDEDRGIRNGMTAMKMLVQQGDGQRPDLSKPFHPNGVLGSLSADDLARAARQLPEPTASQPPMREVEIEVTHLGRGRVTFQLREARHGARSSHLYRSGSFAQMI